jgi:ABC-type sulfate transport system permease subunit
MPLLVEILYNEYQLVGAFAIASLLALLALITLVAKIVLEKKTLLERTIEEQIVEGLERRDD